MNKMKNFLTVAAGAALSLVATTSMAQELVKAPVVNKVGQYTWVQEYVGTDTVCRDVYVQQDKGSWSDGPSGALQGNGDAIAGAIIGGVVGNQVGGGTGKDIATVLGAIIGSNVANGTSKKHGGTIKRTICDEVPQYQRVKQINGWNVTYMYGGRHYKVYMKEDPGTHVTLELNTTFTVRD